MRILLAVDASRDSRNAAHTVLYLADPPELDVLYVVDMEALKHAYISPALPPDYYETYRAEIAEAAEHILHEMKAELAPHVARIRLLADTGDAAESLIQTAEESHPDLIIVGQRGMTATPAFLLGGVSQKAAMYAPCSVLVVKNAPAALEHILLAVDGSEESQRAIEFLRHTPFKSRLRLTLVTVWSEERSGWSHVQAVITAKGEELLQSVAESIGDKHYHIETELLHGDPALSILEAAARRQAQMIVLGSRGMKAIRRFLLGSISQKVLVHAPCSVLIVR